MIHNLINKFKVRITLKEVFTWFSLSFIGVFVVYLSVFHRTLNSLMLIEVFAYAVIFALIMAMTKSYSHYVDGYYQTHIDKHIAKRNSR